MAYKIDALISFANSDNQSPDEVEQGWVDTFKHFLGLMLEQVLGYTPNIVLKAEDDSLSGADKEEVATMITILSDSYIHSGQCLDVLEDYAMHLEKSENNRLFKVLRNPLPLEKQPARIRNLTGYRMFRMDYDTGQAMDFKDYFDNEAATTYWMNIVDIAFDIHETLIALGETSKKLKSIAKRKTIYLAETSHDMIVHRNIIKRELQRYGYKILPDHPLPHKLSELEPIVKGLIEKSDIAIHLIGASYGDIPEGADHSIVDIQNKLVVEKSNASGKDGLYRLVWITPSLKTASEKQITFIENIKRDSDVSENTEILQTPLEDFKNIIRGEIIEGGLEKKRALNFLEEDEENGNPLIYLIHDQVDSNEATKLKSFIENKGFKVLEPVFEGELLDIRQKHINNLRRFDGALVYQKNVNEQWTRMKILDLLKAPGFGRKKPMQGRGIICPQNEEFANYSERGLTLIESGNELEKSVESFLEDIK